MADMSPEAFRDLCEETRRTVRTRSRRPLTEAAVTKAEWQAALKTDKEMLKEYEADLKTLQAGGKVKNLTIDGAKTVIKGLKAVIKNKEKTIASLAETRKKKR